MTYIVYATTNPGKLEEVKNFLTPHGINIKGLSDFNIKTEVEESGATLEENASIKALAYQKLLPEGTIVVADDTGIEIDALSGEPGIKVRRWKGYSMKDEEIITYCMERMKEVPVAKRGAQFRTVLAVAKDAEPVTYFDGILRGEILTTPKAERREGMPFWPMFYIPELKMTLGEFHRAPMEFQLKYPTHREAAALKVLPYLAKLNP
jgi:XTP/dITP diphosphohydrolase